MPYRLTRDFSILAGRATRKLVPDRLAAIALRRAQADGSCLTAQCLPSYGTRRGFLSENHK
jgi:hypothetical protein